MPNQNQWTCHTPAVLLACGLVASLLPGFAVAQDLSIMEERMHWLFERLTEEDHTYRTDGALQSPQVLVSLYVSDGQDEAALEHIVTAMEAIAAATDPTPARGGDIGGQVRTAAPALVRALYKFGDRFSADQLERIKRAVTGEVFTYRMRGHGTENHAMDFVSALYLLPQYFPDAKWSYAQLVGREFAKDGRQTFTSRQMMDEARDKILRRGRGFYRVGHQELLSTTYDVLSARSSVNLWEFASDPVVRDAGEALTLYHVALHALNNFDGHTMPPYNRRNQLQMRFGASTGSSGRLNHHGYAAWLLWGQNEIVPPGVDETQAGRVLRSTGFGQYSFGADPTELASAFWGTELRMPGALNRIAQGAEAPYAIRGANGEYGTWGDAENLAVLRYVWRDRNFAIGGPVAEKFHPGSRPEKRRGDRQRGFYDCYEMFSIVWKSENRLRALEAMHPHWNSNQGEDHWRTTHSPFQQTGVHRNAAITMFNIPDKDPWPDRGREGWIAKRNQHFKNLIKLGQVRFPTTVDEVTANGEFYFFREGDVFVAIRVLKPGHTLHKQLEDVFSNDLFHVVKSREAQTGFVFEVGTAEEHGSFTAFQQAVRNNPLRVDWGKLEVRYTTTHGDELRFRYDTDYSEGADGFIRIAPELWINGKQREVDFNNWPLAESPVMTLKDSILRINQGGEQVEVHWRGEVPRIRRR